MSPVSLNPLESKPNIYASNQDLPKITAQAWDAVVRKNDPPTLFCYGSELCRLEQDEEGRVLLRMLTPNRLRNYCAKAAFWYTIREEKKVPAKPPVDVINNMLADPNPPLPRLNRVPQVPVFGTGGTLVVKPGYNPASRIFHAPPEGLELPEIPSRPTHRDIATARELILGELLGDFPFVHAADEAHALSLYLLPYVRDLIKGPTPNHLVESPTPGSGKDLLVDVCLRPALGGEIAILPECADDSEWHRRITACLSRPREAVLIGNVRRRIDSGVLAAALTCLFWEDRLVGTSKSIRVPVRCIWAMTGNNPQLSTEIARRSIRIRLDPDHARPWERTGFQHPHLRQWADQHRAELAAAALTLVQAWVAEGRPSWQGRPFGSYESWREVMGGILQVIGVDGFLENRDEFYEAVDQEEAELGEFVRTWREEFGSNEIKTVDLLRLASGVGLPLTGRTERARLISLGKYLARQRDRIVEGYRITAARKVKRSQRWKLVRSKATDSRGECGECFYPPYPELLRPGGGGSRNSSTPPENIHRHSPLPGPHMRGESVPGAAK